MEKFSKYGNKLRELALETRNNDSEQNPSTASNLLKRRELLTNSLGLTIANPIKITDIESAKARVKQWLQQTYQIEKIEIALKSFKFYHRMVLMFIYDDIKLVTNQMYPQQPRKQRQLEREIICSQEGIASRSELRYKTSATRILCIISAGIKFEQIIEAGMNVSDFEMESKYYDKFLLSLDLKSIKELNGDVGLLNPITVLPKIPNAVFRNISEISEISEMELDN